MCPEPGYRRAPPVGDGAAGVRPLWVRRAKGVREDRRIDDFDREPRGRGRGDVPRTGRRAGPGARRRPARRGRNATPRSDPVRKEEP